MQQIEIGTVSAALPQIAGVICMGFLVSLSVMDFRYRKVPGAMLITAGVFASAYTILYGEEPLWVSLSGLGIGGLFVLLSRITREGLGYGDSWLLCILGLYLGIWRLFELLVVAWTMVSITAMFLLAMRKYRRKTTLPMIPFITVGFAAVCLSEWMGVS